MNTPILKKPILAWLFIIVLLSELAAFLVLAVTGMMAQHGPVLVAGIMGANSLLAVLAAALVLQRRRSQRRTADADSPR